MKIRQGFVSNSSSSSFICDMCGETYTGWDASPWDRENGCYVCPYGHIMCEEHVKGDIETPREEACEHEFNREECDCCPICKQPAWMYAEDYTINEKDCPVCQFKAYSDVEMAYYLQKTRKVSRDEVFAKIKELNKRRKKLYDSEYITDVCMRFSLTEDLLLKELKNKFGTFDKYAKFINHD